MDSIPMNTEFVVVGGCTVISGGSMAFAGITAPILAIHSRSREEQVDILRQHVADLSVHHIETEYHLFNQIFPRARTERVRNFAGVLDDIPISES